MGKKGFLIYISILVITLVFVIAVWYSNSNVRMTGYGPQQPPEPADLLCSDSDGGKSYSIKGEVTDCNAKDVDGNCILKIDECFGATLTEYFCEGDITNSIDYVCRSGACQSGACVAGGDFDGHPITICSDSDNGKISSTKGYIEGYLEGVYYKEEDKCVTSIKVLEYSCEASGIKNSSEIECGTGEMCYSGACRKCIDYDSTDYLTGNSTIAGKTWNNSLEQEDVCFNSTFLNESYCSGSKVVFKGINCLGLGAGFVCQDNVCFCKSEWKEMPSTQCKSDETYLVPWQDQKNCAKSYDEVKYCDYNKNGIILNNKKVDQIYIDGSEFDNSRNYTGIGIKKVRLEENDAVVEFEWDFSNVLNLYNAEIESSDENDDFGYIMVKELGVSNKTIWFDRLNNSNAVCIRDFENVSLNDFSDDCNSTGEILISCPGNKLGYKCEIINNSFKVWLLNNSGIKEIFFKGKCTSNWSCTDWSNCTNTSQTRICNDINSCGSNSGRPDESKSCGPIPSQQNISECEIETSGTCKQSCETSEQEESYQCENSKICCVIKEKNKLETKIWVYILLGILGLFIVILVVLLIIKKANKSKSDSFQGNIKSNAPPSPPSPPSSQQKNIQIKSPAPSFNQKERRIAPLPRNPL